MFYSPLHAGCISHQPINSTKYLSSAVCCIISTLCNVLWPVVALRCEVNNWMDPLINKVQGERGRRGGRGEMGETGHSSLQSPLREWYDCKHAATSLSLAVLSLPRRCLDIRSISCSDLWLAARSRLWHFNTFPLWSRGYFLKNRWREGT